MYEAGVIDPTKVSPRCFGKCSFGSRNAYYNGSYNLRKTVERFSYAWYASRRYGRNGYDVKKSVRFIRFVKFIKFVKLMK